METITVRRKDNGKLKIMNPANFDPDKHEMIDDEKKDAAKADDKPKRGGAKG